MIRVLLVLLVSSMSLHLYGQNRDLDGKFKVSVSLKNIPEAYIAILTYPQGSVRLADTVRLKSGKCSFSGNLSECNVATLRLEKKVLDKVKPHIFMSENSFQFYLAPGKTTVHADRALKQANYVSSSDFVADYRNFEDSIRIFREQYIYPILKEETPLLNEEERRAYIKEKNGNMHRELREQRYKGFMLRHLDSPVGLLAFNSYAAAKMTDSLALLFNKLSPSIQHLPTGKRYVELVDALQRISVGKMAPDFTIPDTLGKPVSVSSFRGKYVLLDFWASWCYPCRKTHPNLVYAYNRFNSKGFTVFSVSLDNEKTVDAWRRAIVQDQLTWTNGSDLRGWSSITSVLYGVKVVPQNFLIDPDGKIVGINLHEEELIHTLSQLLD